MNEAKKSLRKRAEEQAARDTEPSEDMSAREMAELLEELRIHQIELELQNEELRRSQEEAEKACKAYQDLWEHSPVGYVIIDGSGRIEAVNHNAQGLFGKIPGMPF